MSASTQRRIERAALTLFAQKGFAATGIRELADAAGLSTATLYHYMGAKEDLLFTITARAAERLVGGGRQIVAETVGSPAVQLAALVQLHAYFRARQPMESAVLATETRALPRRERRLVTVLTEDYEQLWTDVLDDGLHRGMFTVPDVGLTRQALMDMTGAVLAGPSARAATAPSPAVEQLADLALGAVRATDDDGRPATAAALGLAGAEWTDYLRRLETRVTAETAAAQLPRR